MRKKPADLHYRYSDGVQGAVNLDDCVMSGESLEFVRCCHERITGQTRDLRSSLLRESFPRVQAGPHRCSSECQLIQSRQRVLDSRDSIFDLSRVGWKKDFKSQLKRLRICDQRITFAYFLPENSCPSVRGTAS